MSVTLTRPTPPRDTAPPKPDNLLLHLALGVLFGIILIKGEVISWFRIQEMFRFQSFHMYGIIGSAVVVAGLSLVVLRRFGIRTIRGEAIRLKEKEPSRGYSTLLGGTVFGLGWGLLGACPGPIYALIGSGVTVILAALASAVVGAWTYGLLRPHLPH